MFVTKLAHAMEGLFWHPVLHFSIGVVLIAPLVLGPDSAEVLPFYLFGAPWMLIALVALALPLLAVALGTVRIDHAVRRNHALEHATIHYLRAGGLEVNGHAEKGGFRLFGRLTPSDIRRAFAEVAVRVYGRMPIPHISPHCGSNRLTATALGLSLLLAAALVSNVLVPPMAVRIAALLAAVLVFYRWRGALGNWVQGRFFMATDFAEVSLRHIKKLRGSNHDGRTAYLVQTHVI
jgi:hypothetical protein